MRPARVVAAGTAILVLAGAPAEGVQGTYVGSYHHSEGGVDQDVLRHRFDLGTRDDLARNLYLDLRLFLTLDSRPGDSNADLFRSRMLGDLRHPNWRLTAQYSPWQRTSASSDIPRDRRADLQLVLNPPHRPQLALGFSRTDREAPTGRSYHQDWRAQMSHEFQGWRPSLSYRRLESGPDRTRNPFSRTEEWRGGVQADRSWRGVSAQTGYDAVYSRFRSLERRREIYVQRFDGGVTWTPLRRWSLGGAGFLRWGKSEDNQIGGIQDLDERSLSGRATFLPGKGFTLGASREYRKSGGSAAGQVSDFARFEALFHRDLRRRVAFQAGYLYTVDLAGEKGSLPANTGYVLLDGRLRRGIAGRVEVRGSRGAGNVDRSLRWSRLAEVRMVPVAGARTDLLVVLEDLPGIAGEPQSDLSWELNLGYQPARSLDLSASYRRLDGRGALDRQERFGSAGATWRTGNRTSVSLNGSKRVGEFQGLRSSSSVVGTDLTFWLPNEFRLKADVRRTSQLGAASTTTYGLILEKSF